MPAVTEASHSQRQDSLSLLQRLSYALPVITTSFLIGPMAVVQGIYAKYFGLPLTTIATVLLVARVFDAVTDPLIGYYSDRYHARTGSRKPFVVCGGVLLVISSYFLYVPVDLKALQTLDENTIYVTVSTGYFLGWFIAFYLAWTLFEIPHLAWANELAGSTQEKNLIYSQRGAAGWLGALLFYIVPLLPVFETNEFTPKSLALAVLLVSGLSFLLLWMCVRITPANILGSSVKFAPNKNSQTIRIKAIVMGISRNKPLLLFVMASILSTTAMSGMWFTLLFIYVDSYLELGDQFALGTLISLVVGILMIAVWCWIANRLGKKNTLALGFLVSAIGILLTGELTQGESGFLSLLLVLILCYGIGMTAAAALAPSLLADIIDYSQWKFGGDHAATYFSLNSVVGKMATAIGGAIGLALVGFYGFDPAADIYTAQNITGFHLAIAWLPAGFVLSSMILFLLNPITTHRHALIRRRLDMLELRSDKSIKPNVSLSLS